MAQDVGDPRLLFTPPGSAGTSVKGDEFEVPSTPQEILSDAPSSKSDATKMNMSVYISPPSLASQEKQKYTGGLLVESESDAEGEEIVEFVGEYRLGSDLFLYARYKDGICRRKLVREFKTSHPELYTEYVQKKDKGILEPFDPSATYVHFKDRVRMVINIDQRKLGSRRKQIHYRSRQNATFKSVNYDQDQASSDEEADSSDQESSVQPRRKSTRNTSAKAKAKGAPRKLPYSPKKTRPKTGTASSKVLYEDEDEEEDASSEEKDHADARITRSRGGGKKVKYVEDDDDFDLNREEDDDDDDDDGKGILVKKPKKKARGKASRPAYGRVRSVSDLYDSDPETAPLRAHRDVCEKCHEAPAHVLLEKSRKKKGKAKSRKKMDVDEESIDEEESLKKLGGWVRCLKCCVAAHWRCLAATQRAEMLKAAREKDKAETDPGENSSKRDDLDVYQTTDFVCGSCSKGGICLVCEEAAVESESVLQPTADISGDSNQDEVMPIDAPSTDDTGKADKKDSIVTPISSQLEQDSQEQAKELLFRCFTCKRFAHYAHLSVNDQEDLTTVEVAAFYQEENEWQCGDCSSYTYSLDKILAWRPYPRNAVEPPHDPSLPLDPKVNLPREYLVKWAGRSYRRTQWVPHMWLVATNRAKLKNFLTSGTKVGLLDRAPSEEAHPRASKDETISDGLALFAISGENSRDASANPAVSNSEAYTPLMAVPDAESRIPSAWKTIDRVLDVLLWFPKKRSGAENGKKRKQQKGKGPISKIHDTSDDEDDEETQDSDIEAEFAAAFDEGEQPRKDLTETVMEWEDRTGKQISIKEVDKVIWVFAKWKDLTYDESVWDSPPRQGDPGFPAFKSAFQRFIQSRQVKVLKMGKRNTLTFEKRGGRKSWDSTYLGIPESGSYDIGQDKKLNLMDFQILGVNWLCRNWFHHQQCILADEMGLGKTVQIVTFLGLLVEKCHTFPALVVVPNSTITNWVREFARWAPKLRVVPFFGDAISRDIIKQYELKHSHVEDGTTGAKYHVLITTYETLTNPRDFGPVFKSVPRWEALIVDEGQRLKSDSSLLFKKLNELSTFHRVIMTGTPLNNNIRELFNLMNFLDPAKWDDLEALEKEHEELTEELVKELHEKLRPYFLRRVKADVLKLPPKNEVIVPVSMAPLQKEVYKSILSQNLNVLRSLTQATSSRINSAAAAKSNLNNMLMQLRKCLQHPYLISEDIEPKGLSDTESHAKLIDGSAKLRLLKVLLPQLKARGHRVLLFSQFVIALNIIEDFLEGEGFKFLRLDGNTKQVDRQASMDEFNREGSDVFIYILSTRAGGVGINLWSADTVIIFDPDFNPHQDLQAIARSHRYGQTKTCLVFKLMVKDSAEERIMQTGKKKMVLDHLIVQKMDDDESGGDVQSILTFGAKLLFDDNQTQLSRDIAYSENDVEKLIEKTEKEGDHTETDEASKAAFAFAKVWSAHNDSLEDLPGSAEVHDDPTDSWAQTLAKIAAETVQVQTHEAVGRGVRRKTAQTKAVYYEGSPEKPKRKESKGRLSPSTNASDTEYNISNAASPVDSEEDTGGVRLATEIADMSTSGKPTLPGADVKYGVPSDQRGMESGTGWRSEDQALSPILNLLSANNEEVVAPCGLCWTVHGNRLCYMTGVSKNLVEYREMLMVSKGDETEEERMAAIRTIEETLLERGHIHLIQGQPLKVLNPPKDKNNTPKPKGKTKSSAHVQAHRSAAPTSSAMGTFATKGSDEAGSSKSRQASHPFGLMLDREKPDHEKQVSTSKRAISPSPAVDLPKKKKAKHGRACSICGQSPHHLAIECPVVIQGPTRVLKVIARLTEEGGHSDTVSILNGILRQQKKKEIASMSTSSQPVS